MNEIIKKRLEEFDNYYHIGQAQILSKKITVGDFKRDIKQFLQESMEMLVLDVNSIKFPHYRETVIGPESEREKDNIWNDAIDACKKAITSMQGNTREGDKG